MLREIGVDRNTPVIQVFNKIDLVNSRPKMSYNHSKVWLSAKEKLGLDYLKEAIASRLYGKVIEKEITVSCADSKLRAKLYNMGAVVNETQLDDGGWKLLIRLTKSELLKL